MKGASARLERPVARVNAEDASHFPLCAAQLPAIDEQSAPVGVVKCSELAVAHDEEERRDGVYDEIMTSRMIRAVPGQFVPRRRLRWKIK